MGNEADEIAGVLERFTGEAARLLHEGDLHEYARVLRDILQILQVLGIREDDDFEVYAADAMRLVNLQ